MGAKMRELIDRQNAAKAELRKLLDVAGETLTEEQEKRCRELKDTIVGYSSQIEYRALVEESEKRQAVASEARRDFRGFSLARAIAGKLNPRVDAGREAEISRELELRGYKTQANGILVPRSYFERRDDPAPAEEPAAADPVSVDPISTANTGAKLIADDFRADLYIDSLWEANPLSRLGIRRLGGLVGDVTIPAAASKTSVAWFTDGDTIADTDMTFAQVKLTPHYVGAISTVSLGLVMQASRDVDKLLAADMSKTLGLEVARAAIVGDGDDGEPVGLLDSSRSIAAIPTNAKPALYAVDCQAALLAENVDPGKISYLVSSACFDDVEGVLTTDGLPVPASTIFRGRPYVYASAMPEASVLCAGDFSELMLAEWGAVEVAVNPYSQFSTGAVQIRIIQAVDVAVRHPAAFVTLGGVAADAGDGD